MSDDLRTRIATIVHDKDTVKCCDECTISSPGPWDYEVADAVIEALRLIPEQTYDPIYGRTSTRYVTAEWSNDES